MKSIYRANLFIRLLLIALLAGSFLLQMAFAGAPRWLRSLLQYAVIFGGTSLLFMRIMHLSASDVGFRKPHLSDLLTGLALGLVLQPPLLLISACSELLFPNPVAASMARILKDPLPLAVLSTAVCPAFFEEWTCRGIYLSDWSDRRPVIAACFSGLVFGLLHLNLQQFPYAFAFGFLIALLALGTGSIWPGILAHCVINTTQLFLGLHPVAWLESVPNIALLSVPCTAAAFLLLRRSFRRPDKAFVSGFTFQQMEPLLHTVLLFIAALLVLR